MKLLLEILNMIKDGNELFKKWTNKNKSQISNLIMSILSNIEDNLTRKSNELYYGFREFFRDSIALMMYAMGFHLVFGCDEIIAKIKRLTRLLEDKARILHLTDINYFREILENLDKIYSKYKDPSSISPPDVNDPYFHYDYVLKLYHSFLTALDSEEAENFISRYLIPINRVFAYTIDLASDLRAEMNKGAFLTERNCFLVTGICNLLLNLLQKILSKASKLFTKMCVKTLSNNRFWENLKSLQQNEHKILENLKCLGTALKDANTTYVGAALVNVELSDIEFDGYIEVLGEEPSGQRRHYIIMIIECKLEMFSEDYSESDRIKTQAKRHLKVIREKIVPYFKLLYRNPPLIAYFLLVNRELSKEIKDILKELENEFTGEDYKICVSFLTHKALERAVRKYSGFSDDLINFFFSSMIGERDH